jgi:hypothetical protein
MGIANITICQWGPQSKEDQCVVAPDWEVVEAAIRALNNRDLNDLYLAPDADDPETYLAVGGGNGRYLVTGSISNEAFPTVVDRGKLASETEDLVVGGQAGDYPSQWIVDLPTALAATRHFYDTNEFSGGGVDWIDA